MARGKKRSQNKSRYKKSQNNQRSSSCNDIEEQLKRQRRKREEESKREEQKDGRDDPTPVLGDFVYDPVRKTYFPKDLVATRKEKCHTSIVGQDSKRLQSIWLHRNHHFDTTKSIPFNLCISESCPTKVSRNVRIRTWCAHRHLLHCSKVIPTCIEKESEWKSLLSPYCRVFEGANNGEELLEPWDLTCKSRLLTTARTFDVACGVDRFGSSENMMPAFVTLVNGGCMLRLMAERSRRKIWNIQRKPHAISVPASPYTTNHHALFYSAARQTGSPDESEPIVGVEDFDAIRFEVRHNKTTFSNDRFLFAAIANHDPSEPARFYLFTKEKVVAVNLPCLVNDFCLSLANGVADAYSLALAPRKRHHNECFSPVFLNMTTNRCAVSATKDFPQSDVLCVEHLLSCPSNDTVLFGHLNGTVSMLDTRAQKRCASILGMNVGRDKRLRASGKTSNNLGGVTNMLSLPDNDHTFLTRHKFGAILLYDLRKMGKTYSATNESLRHHLQPESCDPTMSTYCTGVALDPSGNVVISPFASRDKQPHIGMWSLSNGRMVGSTQLAPSHERRTGALPYCELCSTFTDAFEYEAHPFNTEEEPSVYRCTKRFGLWFKCGNLSPTHAPPWAGSIHQVTCPRL